MSDTFEQLKSQKVQRIQKILSETEMKFQEMIKMEFIDGVLGEALLVSKTMGMFFTKCLQSVHSINNDLELKRKVKDLEQQVTSLDEMLENFQIKLGSAREVYAKNMVKMTELMMSLKQCLEKAKVAKNISELDLLVPPSLEECVQSIDDTGLDQLEEEWDSMNLLEKSADCVCKLIAAVK